MAENEIDTNFAQALINYAIVLFELQERLNKQVNTAQEIESEYFPLLDECLEDLRVIALQHENTNRFYAKKNLMIKAFRAVVGHYLWKSCFHWRAYSKPLGYPGDYQLMEWIYDSNIASNNKLGTVLQKHFMAGPGPRSVRARLQRIEKLLLDTAREKIDDPIKILSLGSGSARELYTMLPKLADRRLQCTLIDVDPSALLYAQNRLRTIASKYHTFQQVRLSVKRMGTEMAEIRDSFDLIYSVGLFDYIEQPYATQLVRMLTSMLAKNGNLFIANYEMSDINPDRFLIEYAHDWFLLLRSEAEMCDLVADYPNSNVTIERDVATESILFVNARKE